MRKLLSLAASLLMLFPATQEAGATVTPGPMAYGIQDTSWQQTDFGSAPTVDLIDDGTTDNVDTLNNFSDHAHRILNCPHGGTARINSTWYWRTGQRFWLKNCTIESTNMTLGIYAIGIPGGLLAIRPITDFRIYGLNFRYATRTAGVRMALVWIDHFKIINFNLDNTGGFLFVRGSDVEIAYGRMTNTATTPGSPGIRELGTDAGVTISPGMHANFWAHHLNFQCGDSCFQACQSAITPGNWLYRLASDDVLYEDSYGESDSSTVTLVNEPQVTDPADLCTNIRFYRVSGAGTFYALIGNSNTLTQFVTYDTGSFDVCGKTGGFGCGLSSNPMIQIGAFKQGKLTATDPNTQDVTIRNITVLNEENVAAGVNNATRTTFDGVNFGPAKVGKASKNATIKIDGAVDTVVKNSTIDAGNNPAAISDGAIGLSTGTVLTNNHLINVIDSKSGILLGSSVGAIVSGNRVTPAIGATLAQGIAGTANPNGTTGANVTGNDLSAMPVPIVCPPSGQSNFFSGNTGAQPCPR